MYMFALSRHLNLVFRDRKRDMLSKRIWIIDSRAQVKTFVFTDLFCLGETIKKILFVISTLRKRQRESCFMNKLKTVSWYDCEQKRFRRIYNLLAKIKERRYDKIYKAIRREWQPARKNLHSKSFLRIIRFLFFDVAFFCFAGSLRFLSQLIAHKRIIINGTCNHGCRSLRITFRDERESTPASCWTRVFPKGLTAQVQIIFYV